MSSSPRYLWRLLSQRHTEEVIFHVLRLPVRHQFLSLHELIISRINRRWEHAQNSVANGKITNTPFKHIVLNLPVTMPDCVSHNEYHIDWVDPRTAPNCGHFRRRHRGCLMSRDKWILRTNRKQQRTLQPGSMNALIDGAVGFQTQSWTINRLRRAGIVMGRGFAKFRCQDFLLNAKIKPARLPTLLRSVEEHVAEWFELQKVRIHQSRNRKSNNHHVDTY